MAAYNVFLKSYFAMTIEAKELQHEVNRFLKNLSLTYAEILERTHTQITGEHMRDTTTRSGASRIRRWKSDGDADKTKVTESCNAKARSD